MPLTNEERLAKVEAQKAKTDRYHAQLVRVATAEAEIPGIWETGQVSKKKLANEYGISVATVTRILDSNGLEQTRYRKVKPEDKAEIIGLHKSGVATDQIAAHMGVSRNTTRRVLIESGLVEKGHRAPRRSAEEYELIRAFDAEARARFNGAGLYNLGMGLRQWDAKQAVKQREAVASSGAGGIPPEEDPPAWPEPEGENTVQQWTPNDDILQGGNALNTAAHPLPQDDHSPADETPNAAPDPDPQPVVTTPDTPPDKDDLSW